MIHSSADLLEFDALRDLLARYIGSPIGHRHLDRLQPCPDRRAAEAIHNLNAEAIDYLKTAAKPQNASRGSVLRLSFTNLPDSTQASIKLRIEGAALEGKEIFDLTGLLDRASDTRIMLESCAGAFPLLAAKAAAIGELRPLLQDISNRILPDGTVADHASVALNRIRRGIEKQKRLIQESLERFLKSHRSDGVLQEDFVTLRNDRFVVPIVTGQQGRINGVIHGSSGSGHTLFVEPLDTIQLNNDLVRLTEEELREVHRILQELTAKLRAHSPQITAAIEVMGELDFLFAKANFAVEFHCVLPTFTSDDTAELKLESARHPLLEDILRRQKKPIIPITFSLHGDQRTLLLSGPNTGGKTVSLKTTGLLALMAQSGIPVPAREAVLPWFDQILADLGDNQSIAESLSSFSSHIRRIKEILSLVTPDSLVLLDELGRATDPEEGGALGVAIVDMLRSWRCFTLASTHLLALKIYGGSRQGVLNGSMGFDRETLEPTYVLRVGSPGESAGLAIASRLGLPSDVIEKARAAMTTRERDLTDFLEQLQFRITEATAERQRYEEQRLAFEAREKALAVEYAKREAAKVRELEQRCEQMARTFEEQSRQTIESITQNVQQRKATEQAQRKVSKTIREFKEGFHSTVLAKADAKPEHPILNIEEGCRVRLKNVRELARVRRKLANGIIEVEAGFMKMQVSIDDVIEVVKGGGEGPKLPKNVSFQGSGPKWDISYREINLIGKRAEEALEEVDKFLDQAVMASVDRVRIVHGHGMGILKKAVNELLATHPHVARHYPGTPAEGGTGATVVELREN